MDPQPLPGPLLAALALVALALGVAALAQREKDAEVAERVPPAPQVFSQPAAADPIPYDGRSPRLAAATDQRVLVALPRPALAERADLAELDGAARIAYVKSLEREGRALRGALTARGVELRDVVTFERAWNGFAATIAARDLARLNSLGVRTRPVRRFFPATSEPVRVPATGASGPAGGGASGPAATGASGPAGGGASGPAGARATGPGATPTPAARRAAPAAIGSPPIALLAGGVTAPRGDERFVPGYDAVDRDTDPAPGRDPRDPARSETSGDALAGVILQAGERVLPIRVSGLRAAPGAAGIEEFGTTDELLAGIERAVDPDGNRDPGDHAPIALIGVNAPYAGFADAPEAEAVRAAHRIGTLVIAAAGNEGPARGPHGTIGSPGAAASFTVGALTPRDSAARADLTVDAITVRAAALLGGSSPTGELTTAGPLLTDDPAVLLRPEAPRIAGRAAIVRAGVNTPAQAAAAAAAGAAAIVIAEPRAGRTLPAMPAGRIPVPVLGVTGDAAAAILEAGADRRLRVTSARLPSVATDAGAMGSTRRSRFSSRGPALDGSREPDWALVGVVAARGEAVAGTAIAAARVASRAAQVLRSLAERRGGAVPVDALARALQTSAEPLGDRGRTGPAAGARAAAPVAEPAVPLGTLRLERRDGNPAGVRFTLGAFDRGDPTAGVGTKFFPAARLDLTLEAAAGGVTRRLTPPGGERGLLPGEYVYTLTRGLLSNLDAGTYRFRVRARGPRSTRSATKASPAFTVG